MKPFNLEEAKAGKPVCTRDGHKARILCTDLADKKYPVVAAVLELSEGGRENVGTYNTDGRHLSNQYESPADLFMAPVKREGWVNIYRRDDGSLYCGDVYPTKAACHQYKGMAIVPIEWEE